MFGLLHQPHMTDVECGSVGGIRRMGVTKYSDKTCPNVALSITNPTGPDLGSNPGRRGRKPSTNDLSHFVSFSGQALAHQLRCINVEQRIVMKRHATVSDFNGTAVKVITIVIHTECSLNSWSRGNIFLLNPKFHYRTQKVVQYGSFVN
jgi:hypothetical protein